MEKMFRSGALTSVIIICFCLASEGQGSSDLKTAFNRPTNLAGGDASTEPSHSDEKAAPLKPPNPATIAVREEEPVISIHGLCAFDKGVAENDSKSCVTTVTRQQFDLLLEAANVSGQQVSTLARQNFAKGYVLYLAFEQAAKKAGFEDTDQFLELMRWARLRAVTDAYRGKIVADARNAQQAEVDAYYKEHLDFYDRISIMTVSVPRMRPKGSEDKAFDERAYAVIQDARQRLIQGDSPEEVQKGAYASLDLFGPPVVDLLIRTRSDLPELKPEQIVALKPGEVSDIQKNDGSYFIHKIVSHDVLPESTVQPGIVRTIAENKVRLAFDSIETSIQAEYNVTYFGAPQQSPVPLH